MISTGRRIPLEEYKALTKDSTEIYKQVGREIFEQICEELVTTIKSSIINTIKYNQNSINIVFTNKMSDIIYFKYNFEQEDIAKADLGTTFFD